MADVSLSRATTHDAIELGPLMKPDDVNEVYAALGLSPVAGLVFSLAHSETALTARLGGEPFLMCGICRNGEDGMPWLLGSDRIHEVGRRFLRETRAGVMEMKRRYRTLYNYVDARHEVSIRWLGWLGFEIQEAAPYGFEGRPFHRFEMR